MGKNSKSNNSLVINKDEFKDNIMENLKNMYGKTLENATSQDLYNSVAYALRNSIMHKWIATEKQYKNDNVKQMYYLSAEFLMGRALGNNMISLGAEKAVKEALKELNIDYNLIEDIEPDAGLGNGGLGRLAACFLDSLAALQLPGHGCSIRYRYGIFEQKIIDGYQVEIPDKWLDNGNPWEVKRPEDTVEVKFGGFVTVRHDDAGNEHFIQENCQTVLAIPYDMPIVGYKNNTVNTLRLWDAEAPKKFDLQSFDQGNYPKAVEQENLAETITEVLYPNDNHYQGKELRLKQQYFFVSASLQTIVKKFKETNTDFKLFPQKISIQLNDTHPTVAIPELMRILIDQEGLTWDDAWEIVTKTCAYTNHTILSEALEKWPVELFSRLLPRIYQIAEEINRRFCLELMIRFNDQDKIRRMAIIADGQIRMAWLAIIGSHSVNGVAALHTEILKNQELKDFYEIYPEKFNNKTNGITQRRWLLECNPELAELITETIGTDKWATNLDLVRGIEKYAKDKEFQEKFMKIKFNNKVKLANYIKQTLGVDIDPTSIFDIQAKRLHEYKRQLLNILHIIYLYNSIRNNPKLDIYPRTFIFAAKSAPGYRRAKLIIKLINQLGKIINNDPLVNNRIKVVFLENYRVSLGEKIFPAADLSEQISTASKEASGTGNMKFALNGALTIGTLDGANVEIKEEVGDENIFIFGLKAEEVIAYEKNGGYNPWDLYNCDQTLRNVLNSLVNGTICPEDPELFREIYDSLLNGHPADEYFLLKDFESYRLANEQVDKAYRDKQKWAEMAIYNTARVGKFSSDRTIKEYADEIWNLRPVEVKLP